MNAIMKTLNKCVIITLLYISAYISADPWGKDADLSYYPSTTCIETPRCRTPLLGQFAEIMINFHQTTISPADGPRSNYKPSSSQYTLDAMRKYGFFRGFAMGCDRLMRENKDPWVYQRTLDEYGTMIKLDPVP